MGWSYVDANAATAGATSVAVTKPAGTADGDLLVAIVTNSSGSTGVGAPAGWTPIGTFQSANPANQPFWRIASGEGASWTFTGTDGSRTTAAVGVFRHTAGSGAFDASGVTQTASGTTVSAPSVTPATAGDLGLFLVAVAGTNTLSAAPTNYTAPAAGAVSGSRSAALAYRLDLPSGATGTLSGTITSTLGNYGWNVVFAPPSAPTAGPRAFAVWI